MFQAKPFSFEGKLSLVTVGSSSYNAISGQVVGYDGISSYFTTREHSSSCFPELSFADVCQSAKRLFLCGGSNQSQVCAVATDSSGFRIFNDNTACPWGEPLLWYSTLDGPLEGQHVTLASVNEAAACTAGQRFAHPFITDWRGTLSDLAQQYSGQGVTLTNGTSDWKDWTKPCGDTTDPGVILAGGYLSFGKISPSDVTNRCNRTLTMTATLQDDGYLAFSHQSFGNWQCSYSQYYCGNLKVHVDGVQVYPDPRTYYSWDVSSDWTVFRSGTIPKGNRTILFSYVPPIYWYKPYPRTQPNIGAGIDSLILTGTVKAGQPGFCVPCPAGTCSDYGSSACNPCPLGFYADSKGSAVCSSCANAKLFPYHAQWSNIGETKPTCDFNCGPGYVLSDDQKKLCS